MCALSPQCTYVHPGCARPRCTHPHDINKRAPRSPDNGQYRAMCSCGPGAKDPLRTPMLLATCECSGSVAAHPPARPPVTLDVRAGCGGPRWAMATKPRLNARAAPSVPPCAHARAPRPTAVTPRMLAPCPLPPARANCRRYRGTPHTIPRATPSSTGLGTSAPPRRTEDGPKGAAWVGSAASPWARTDARINTAASHTAHKGRTLLAIARSRGRPAARRGGAVRGPAGPVLEALFTSTLSLPWHGAGPAKGLPGRTGQLPQRAQRSLRPSTETWSDLVRAVVCRGLLLPSQSSHQLESWSLARY